MDEYMNHQWNIDTLTEEDKEVADRLTQAGKLFPLVGDLVIRRGVRTPDDLRKYLEPSLDDLHDPFLMAGMSDAVHRINRAIGNKEKILVYGDYDVDGTTAVTLVYRYLRMVTAYIDYYIPDRYEEGSGISRQSVDYAVSEGFSLVIALDCGIKANDMVEYARTKGIDYIICDHHRAGETLPPAVANLNPKLPDSGYPCTELSGCGVGFKLMQAFAISNGSDMRGLYELLDLVAVSIAADLVPLVDENRTLAHFGLKKLNQNPALGLKGIIDVSGIKSKHLDISDIIFKIGPRLNASGRMQSGRESVELLLARSQKEAKALSHHIDEYNTQRRQLDLSITRDANDIVEGFTDMEGRKVIIVYDPSWHNGVIGIVASRLSEKYNRPTIVLTDTANNLVNGSARSVENYDVYNLIESCQDVLENFGGHPFAAGLTIKKKNLHRFIQKANQLAEKELRVSDMMPKFRVDAEIKLKDITPVLRRQIEWMAPFGPGNEEPLFCTHGVVCVTPPRATGFKKSHLRLVLSMPHQMPIMQAIAYNQAPLLAELTLDTPFDILYTIEEQVWKGKKSIQLNIKDIHIPSSPVDDGSHSPIIAPESNDG